MRIINPKVNYLVEPFIDRKPAISWQLEGDVRGQAQASYRITVREADTGLTAHDTGWVESNACTNILLDMQLRSLTPYSFTIEAKDNAGKDAETCTSSFSGAMCGEKFKAKWITGENILRKDQIHGAVYLRKEFEAPKAIRRATLVICGLGFFEATINGVQVGDEFMSTPLTAFDLNTQYRVFDVTGMVAGGANAIGVKLGNGYYNCFTEDAWNTNGAPWRDVPKLLCEIHIVDEDGDETVVVSDKSWKSSYGPITFNGTRHGEFYDARLEMPGWDKPNFDESKWEGIRYVRLPGGVMTVMEMEPIRVIRKFHPVKKWKSENGWMFDTGVAQAGVSNITYHGKAGDTIEVRYSDRIRANNELDQESLNGFVKNFKFQTDNYTKATDEPETWHATFAFHGFQYFEISGNDWEPELEDIEIWSLCNDFPVRGHFTCSDEDVNQVQQLALNSIRSMCFSVVNADTVREKLCWTGDTGLSTEMMMINFAAEAFMTKMAQDIRDAQKPSGLLPCIIPTTGWGYTFANGPDWSMPIYCIPQQLYIKSGDTRELKKNYEALDRFVTYLGNMAVDGISACGLGDWCAPFDGAPLSVNMSAFKCPMAITDTAYYYGTVKAAEQCATVLGYEEEAKKHHEHAEYVRAAFRREFFDKENFVLKFDPKVEGVKPRTGDCQTATASMIAFGLADEDELPGLFATLTRQIERDNNHHDVGVLGMNSLMESLGQSGNAQLGADLLTAEGYPSIKNWIAMGATTLWEIWNGGGSHNHHMYSSVSAFLYKYFAGIRAAKPGYEAIDFEPMLTGHTESAKATIDAMRGLTAIDWKKTETGFTVKVTVPVSCTAQVKLPAEYAGKCVKCALTESGKPIAENAMISTCEWERGIAVCIPSGTWEFAL